MQRKTSQTKLPGIALAVVCLTFAIAVQAQQQPKISRIGALLYSDSETDPNFKDFRRALRDLGYAEGTNLTIEARSANRKPERLPELAADLVRRNPALIYALGGDTVPATQKATTKIPIVMFVSNDPVRTGFVKSLAHPGSNITGVTLILDELAGKRLSLLKEIIPDISHVAVLWNPDHADPEFREMQREAKSLKLRLQSLEVRETKEFDTQLQNAVKGRADALVVVSSRLLQSMRGHILQFAAAKKLPVIGDWGEWSPDGALFSYGPEVSGMIRRTAVYVDKILKGAKPADLPVERPTRFELVINLVAAKQIGLIIPPNVLARADKVIR